MAFIHHHDLLDMGVALSIPLTHSRRKPTSMICGTRFFKYHKLHTAQITVLSY